MAISKKMNDFAQSSSWIRKMFEEGIRMKEKFGADNVFDFSLGNPDVPPPAAVKDTVLELIDDPAVSHGYMPNTGYPHVRQAVGDYLNKEYSVGLTADLIVMASGAAGALNDVLKARGDSVTDERNENTTGSENLAVFRPPASLNVQRVNLPADKGLRLRSSTKAS